MARATSPCLRRPNGADTLPRAGSPCHDSGFTLVELLVVIGIIALLISILIPTLAKAKEAANSAKCLSNSRQLVMASKLFANDHRGTIPTDSDDQWATAADPYQQHWVWRTSTNGTGRSVKDWASMLMPYLGYKSSDLNTFMAFANGSGQVVEPKIFVCPSDIWQDQGLDSGYKLFNNVVNPPGSANGYFPISYGINADIATICDQGSPLPVGRFGKSDSVSVSGGPNNGNPLACRIDAVFEPSRVMLFADCGTRPHTGSNPLDYSDSLYYTTNYMSTNSAINSGANKYKSYTLEGVSLTSWLKDRIPLKRHKNKVNVAFCDGHGETVSVDNFNQVRVSPYRVQP